MCRGAAGQTRRSSPARPSTTGSDCSAAPGGTYAPASATTTVPLVTQGYPTDTLLIPGAVAALAGIGGRDAPEMSWEVHPLVQALASTQQLVLGRQPPHGTQLQHPWAGLSIHPRIIVTGRRLSGSDIPFDVAPLTMARRPAATAIAPLAGTSTTYRCRSADHADEVSTLQRPTGPVPPVASLTTCAPTFAGSHETRPQSSMPPLYRTTADAGPNEVSPHVTACASTLARSHETRPQ